MTLNLKTLSHLDVSNFDNLVPLLAKRAQSSAGVGTQLTSAVQPLNTEISQAVQTIYKQALADAGVFRAESAVIASVGAAIGIFAEAAHRAQAMVADVYAWADINHVTVNADTGEIEPQNSTPPLLEHYQIEAKSALNIGRTADHHLSEVLTTTNAADLTPEAVSGDKTSRVDVGLETLRTAARTISDLETSAGTAQTKSDIGEGGISSFESVHMALESAAPLYSFCGYGGNSWLKGRRTARTSILMGLSSDLNASANGFLRIDDESAGRLNIAEPHRLRNGPGAPVSRT